MKKWEVRKIDDAFAQKVAAQLGVSPLCAQIISSRGFVDVEDVTEFFSTSQNFDLSELSDPFLLEDMQRACGVINEAIDRDELICIYGDYDCDGVTSTVVLYKYLECLGANITYYIPERNEGYGLNKNAIKNLYDEGVSLIITVDNGVSAIEEAQYIKELSMKLVITDHHQPPEILPEALAIVNPHRKDDYSPFKQLAGVGVAMKLIAALEGGNYDVISEQFADIIAIGTIADVVPLFGENRLIVQNGLRILQNTENAGLADLVKKSSKQSRLDAIFVAFMIAPRINAAGRFGSPKTAVELFLDEYNSQEIVTKLDELNAKRKNIENDIFIEINEFIEKNPQCLDERILFFSGENWHHGVIGIVASRLVEQFGKPAFIMTIEGNEVRGSVRSVKGYSIFNALTACKNFLTKFGGHELAGGFSLEKEKLNSFKNELFCYTNKNFVDMPKLSVSVDKVLTAQDLTVEAFESLNCLEPFGEGNKSPIFLVLGAKLEKIIALSQNKHTKFELTYDGVRCEALLFGTPPQNLPFQVGDIVDLLVDLGINEYNGRKTLTLKVKDYRQSGLSQAKYFSARDCYEKFKRDEKLDKKFVEAIVPTRDELVNFYKYIKNIATAIAIDYIFVKYKCMNYCKLRLSLDIFEECGFVKINYLKETVEFIIPKEKKDLEKSLVLKKLRNLL